jgi:hypothetical protein
MLSEKKEIKIIKAMPSVILLLGKKRKEKKNIKKPREALGVKFLTE